MPSGIRPRWWSSRESIGPRSLRRSSGYVYVVALEDGVWEIGGIRFAFTEAFEGGLFVAEGGEEGVGKFGGVKGLRCQGRYRDLDFDGIHLFGSFSCGVDGLAANASALPKLY